MQREDLRHESIVPAFTRRGFDAAQSDDWKHARRAVLHSHGWATPDHCLDIDGAVFMRGFIAVLVLALAACGGGGGGTPPATVATASPSPASPTETPTPPITTSASTADLSDPVAAAGAAPQPAAAATGLSANAADVANTTIAGNQFVRSVDALAGGGYAVTWSSAGSLFVQRYDAQGAKLSGETRVAYDATASENPAIAVLRDGTVAVASVRADGAVFVRRFDASGKAALGADTVVALPANFPLAQPVLQSLGDGGFAAGWASNEQDAAGPARAQHVQRFDAQSRPVASKRCAMPGWPGICRVTVTQPPSASAAAVSGTTFTLEFVPIAWPEASITCK
jgi:hypothetical protein